jgi:hypothetical protein
MEPREATPDDPEIAEEWVRETSEPDVLDVGASRWVEPETWPWRVWVAAAEFVRNEPLESTLRKRMDEELRAVAGVIDVAEEDRGFWAVAGDPTGAGLARAAALVVDELATRVRKELGTKN